MNYRQLVTLLFVVSAGRYTSEQKPLKADILVPPTSINTTLGSIAIFSCDAIGDFGIIWSVDDILQDHPSLDARGIDVHTTHPDPTTRIRYSTLRILATSQNNGSRIQCITASPIVPSANVTLLIQGLLTAVSDLDLVPYNTTHLMLNWTAPYTLDITDLDPDIHYIVCNTATNSCVNTTDVSYPVPVANSHMQYNVRACNPVGCSEWEEVPALYDAVVMNNSTSTASSTYAYSLTALSSSPLYTPTLLDNSLTNQDSTATEGLDDSTNGGLTTITYAAIGGAVVILLGVIGGVFSASVLCIYAKSKRRSQRVQERHVYEDVEITADVVCTKRNQAYTNHILPPPRIGLKPCSAYEHRNRPQH